MFRYRQLVPQSLSYLKFTSKRIYFCHSFTYISDVRISGVRSFLTTRLSFLSILYHYRHIHMCIPLCFFCVSCFAFTGFCANNVLWTAQLTANDIKEQMPRTLTHTYIHTYMHSPLTNQPNNCQMAKRSTCKVKQRASKTVSSVSQLARTHIHSYTLMHAYKYMYLHIYI